MATRSPAATNDAAQATNPAALDLAYSDLAPAFADQLWDGSVQVNNDAPASDADVHDAHSGAFQVAAADLQNTPLLDGQFAPGDFAGAENSLALTGLSADIFGTLDAAHAGIATSLQLAAIDFDNFFAPDDTSQSSKPAWLHAFDTADWSDWDSFKLTLADAGDQSAQATKAGDPDDNTTSQTHHAVGSAGFWTPAIPDDTVTPVVDLTLPTIGTPDLPKSAPPEPSPVWTHHADEVDPAVWTSLTSSQVNTPPVVWINHPYGPTGASSHAGLWVSYADADGDAAVQYQFWDDNADPNSAHIAMNNAVTEPAQTLITVAAADLSDVWVQAGAAGTSDNVWVRGSDGKDWSGWQPIHFATDSSGDSYGVVITLAQPTLNNFTWDAGPGVDTFPFQPGDTFHIADFDPAEDVIAFNNTSLTDFNAIMANAHDDAQGNAVLTHDGGGTITLDHVSTSQLHASNFVLT